MQNLVLDDSIYVLDVALTEHGLKVIECNCFATSGQYALDKVKLIAGVISSLESVYNEYYVNHLEVI